MGFKGHSNNFTVIDRLIVVMIKAKISVHLLYLCRYYSRTRLCKEFVYTSALLPLHELHSWRGHVQSGDQIRIVRKLVSDEFIFQLFYVVHNQLAFPVPPLSL